MTPRVSLDQAKKLHELGIGFERPDEDGDICSGGYYIYRPTAIELLMLPESKASGRIKRKIANVMFDMIFLDRSADETTQALADIIIAAGGD